MELHWVLPEYTLMEKQHNNRFLAWLFDAFILECVFLPIRYALLENQNLLSYAGLFLLLGVFVLSIIYHMRWTHGTTWISPGETMIGVQLKEGVKVQTNPFTIRRLVLIILIIFNLISTARTLDPSAISYFGQSGMVFIWFFGSIYNVILLTGIWLLGQARKMGLILIMLAFLLMFAAQLTNVAYFDMPQFTSNMWNALFLLLANLAIGGYYFHKQSITIDS